MIAHTDQQLLRDYVEHRSEAAFADLVQRHIDLVYSAALRRVADPHLAEDVTQGTFAALAQHAQQLIGHPVLSGWLHRTTQNIATNVIRTNSRRQAREQEAVNMNQLLSSAPDANWQDIAPHLDAALDELGSDDRDAVMLRYFEKKSAREMAAQLGIGDEAAQKRVSRAVERLREFFAKRGVTVGASGLVIAITANAVQAAPVGLVLAISTAAALTGTTLATTATATVTKAIAMTTLQKTLIGATLAVAVGTAVYQTREASTSKRQIQTFEQRTDSLTASNEAALAALQQKADLLVAQNTELAGALARANADKVRIETERETARRSAALFKELANRQLAETSSTNAYPSERHAMAELGRLVGRFAELKQQAQGNLSPQEKSSYEAMQMALAGDAFTLMKALKQFENNNQNEPTSVKPDHADGFTCMLYGALNLDEQQFSQVHVLMQKVTQQKNLLAEAPVSGTDDDFLKLMEQGLAEIRGLLNPEQNRMLEQIRPFFQVSRNQYGFNFNVDATGKKAAAAK